MSNRTRKRGKRNCKNCGAFLPKKHEEVFCPKCLPYTTVEEEKPVYTPKFKASGIPLIVKNWINKPQSHGCYIMVPNLPEEDEAILFDINIYHFWASNKYTSIIDDDLASRHVRLIQTDFGYLETAFAESDTPNLPEELREKSFLTLEAYERLWVRNSKEWGNNSAIHFPADGWVKIQKPAADVSKALWADLKNTKDRVKQLEAGLSDERQERRGLAQRVRDLEARGYIEIEPVAPEPELSLFERFFGP